MMPYSEINIGDIYSSSGCNDYVVLEKNDEEKMVKISCCGPNMKFVESSLNQPFWKKSSADLFSPRNRVWEG